MIQKFIIDLNLPEQNNAFKIQQDLSSLTNTKLRIYIDEAIKKLNLNKNETFFIPKIEIDLGTISKADYLRVFEQKFKIAFTKELTKAISASQKQTHFSLHKISDLDKINEFENISNVKNSDFFALKFFILKGYFPWWFDAKSINLQELILKYAKQNPSDFLKFIFSTNKKENEIKISRLFNILNSDEFLLFMNLIFINKYYSQRADIKKFLKIVKENLSKNEFVNILSQIFTDISISKKELLESKTGFINFVVRKINIIDEVKQKKILTEAKTAFVATKDIKIHKIVEQAIKERKIKTVETQQGVIQKTDDKESLSKGFVTEEIEAIEKYQEIIEEYERKEFLRKNFTTDEIKAIERYLNINFKYDEKELLNKIFSTEEVKSIERYLQIDFKKDEKEISNKNFTTEEIKVIEKYLKIDFKHDEKEILDKSFTTEEIKAIEKYLKIDFKYDEKEFLRKKFTQAEIKSIEKYLQDVSKYDKKEILNKNFTQAEIKSIEKYLQNVSKYDKKEILNKNFTQAEIKTIEKYLQNISKYDKKEILDKNFTQTEIKSIEKYLQADFKFDKKEILNKNFTTGEIKAIEEYQKIIKEFEEKKVLDEKFTKEELGVIEKYQKTGIETEEEKLSKNFTTDEIKAIKKYLEIDTRYNKKEVLDKKFSQKEKEAVKKFLKIVEYDKKEILGKKFSKTELLSIEKYLELSSKSSENQVKEFSLDLFDYDFIKNLLFAFFATNTFPRWSEKVYSYIKATKRLYNDIQVVEYVFSYISQKYYQKFIPDFYSFISQPEIAKIICENYPNSFILKILTFLYQSKTDLFNQLYQKITNYLDKNTNLSSLKILFIVNYYFIINYKYIFENISEQSIDNIFDKLFVKTEFDEISVNLKDESQKLLLYKELFKTLIETGNLPDNLVKITRKEIFDAVENFDKQFLISLLQTDKNRFVFISLLPENIIIVVLQKLFDEDFTFLNQIWTELNIILTKLKLTNRLKKELQKYLYIIAFEIVTENVTDKNIWLQKYFSALKNFFRVKLPDIDFENKFFEVINSIQKQRIPIFEKFVVNEMAVFFSSYTPESFIEKNIQIIGFNFIFYLKYGYLHWSFPFINLQKLAKLISNNSEKIIVDFGEELQEILNSKFAIQRLFTMFNSKIAEGFLEKLHSPIIDAGKIIEQERRTKLNELKNLFPDKNLEETYEKIVQEKIDWVNEPDDIEKIYVKNAGLVILCNFISFLFKRTKLIVRKGKKHVFKDEQAQERAVLLIQYLVTGNEDFKEHELILNKIICGVELRKPINTKLKLTDKEKQEAEMLLKSVIGHWEILGSTSNDSLRETFLQREGVISLKNSTYNVIVEQKAIDVLMSKLPWTFQTIKLSWTDYVIYVEWNV